MATAEINTLPCSRCKKVKEKVVKKQTKDQGTSSHDQIICSDCNNQQSRLNRMLKHISEAAQEDYSEMTPEQRAEFNRKAAGLCGPELKKVLEEQILWSKIAREATQFKYEGDFVSLDKVEEAYKDKPEQLESLKSNAPRIDHIHTGETMLWIATPHMRDEKEIRTTTEKNEF